MENSGIRVLLVHDILLMCNILAAALEGEEDIKIVGCATSIEDALIKVEVEDVDIVLASARLPDHGSLHLTETIANMNPGAQVIVLGITENKESILQYIEAGAAGYVLKDNTVEDMLQTIRTVHEGEAIIEPHIASAMMERISDLAKMFSNLEKGIIEKAGLTNRELEVLTLLGKNMSNQEIADYLVIEVGTVKNHVHNILNKLNVSSRDEAATYLILIRNIE